MLITNLLPDPGKYKLVCKMGLNQFAENPKPGNGNAPGSAKNAKPAPPSGWNCVKQEN
jgi:hypothetical protein